MVQALSASEASDRTRLWVVTRDGVSEGENGSAASLSQSTLWGLGKVVSREHPEIWGGLVDLGAGGDEEQSQQLAAELNDSEGEQEILLRCPDRFVSRLTRGKATTWERTKFAGDGAYLITGGYGGLGLTVGQWMVRRGARHLVLVGRRGASTEAARAGVEALKELGANVIEAKADVSNAKDVERVLAELDDTHSPLRGIVHAAGVLSDGILRHQDWKQFERVMAPKVQGGWNLHVLTRDRDLDFFVSFSSLASVWGSPGQGAYASANSFLDALMHYRRESALPGLSINWGPWSTVGMASTEGVADSFARRGMALIDPEQGLAALDRLLAQRETQMGVLSVDWPTLASRFGKIPSLFQRFIEAPKDAGDRSKAQGERDSQLGDNAPFAIDSETPRDERRALILERIQIDIEKVMGTAVPGTEQPLIELGLDSLMAVQVSNRLTAGFGVDGLAQTLLGGASVDDLVDLVEHGVDAKATPGSAVPAAGELSPERAEELLASIDRLSDDEVQSMLRVASADSGDGNEEPS